MFVCDVREKMALSPKRITKKTDAKIESERHVKDQVFDVCSAIELKPIKDVVCLKTGAWTRKMLGFLLVSL